MIVVFCMDIQVVAVVSRLVLLKVTNVSGGRRLVRYRSGSLDGDVQPPLIVVKSSKQG